MVNVDYPSLLELFPQHLDSNRSESASFLIWYLQHYYRLDDQEAVDFVCDQRGDKGVDGIFVNDDNQTITIFQAQISQRPDRTVGDTGLRALVGTMAQFGGADSIRKLIEVARDTQVAKLALRLGLIEKIDTHKLIGEYVSNINIDQNGLDYLQQPIDVAFIGKDDLVSNYISDSREIPQKPEIRFNIREFSASEYIVDAETKAIIAPIQARELVSMNGITDQSLFAYNVRGALDRSAVNREITQSIKNKSVHKMFPLFHNGITVIAQEVVENDGDLTVSGYFVVNGCQSLTALYRNRHQITDDLRILVKFIKLDPNSVWATHITNYSNNQNGVRPRDFKANTGIQIRLQNEVERNYRAEYAYSIKRGEETPAGAVVISNEDAGLNLRAFDLKEPWTTHRKYEIFEDKHAEIFGRPMVNADRIVLLQIIMEEISSSIPRLQNQLVAKYALTRYCILYIVREILESDEMIGSISQSPHDFVRKADNRAHFRKSIATIVGDVVGDLNDELRDQGPDFDYRDKMRDSTWVKEMTRTSVGDHRRLVDRGKLESFKSLWELRG